ncbi:hypothetical protein K1719_036141 [Acacia pycnantha]|nr:hypothetical protein K1719_036141 [Acacia pycnantha]
MLVEGLNVLIPVEEKARLAKCWQNALIVKLLGRMIDADYLEKKSSDTSDYDLALTGGPWLIFDHYLLVQP